ncbi:MAG: hypothetical protein VYB95_04595, partial [Verrucomicrobiota bacterium]|nr:hypothetical protein [Verrucomicrobiota bacterium]
MTFKFHLINSIVLVVFGLWGYSVGGSFTALIPVFFGLVLLSLYKGVKNEAKVPAHLAVLLTIIILIALIVQPLQVALSSGNVGKILRSSVMIITSATSTIAFIVSFINVRRKKGNL